MRVNTWESAFHAEVLRSGLGGGIWQKGAETLCVANCVARITGVDPLPVEVGESRLKVARQMSVTDLATLCRWPEVQPAFAQRGDVVMIDKVPGVVALDGRRVWILRRQDGRVALGVSELKKATKAWRIG